MAQSLQQRQIGYEESSYQSIIRRIPIIIKINGRSFSRVTQNTPKPFCHKTMALMSETMLSLAKQIDGVVFGYQYSDKIILVLRNDRSKDEDPWFGNSTQKMSSAAASSATYEFMNQLWGMDNPPDLNGSITFTAHSFGVPSIVEAVNYLMYRQHRCMESSINSALYSVLWPRFGKDIYIELEDKNISDRKKILEDSNFNFDKLPIAYRRGVVAYAAPTLANTANGQITKKKWVLDPEAPIFVDNKERIKNILLNGSDIFRPERDLNAI